ncbi:MAG: hypothetical protein ACD_29C00227G0003 [uncultured bacterium]|nr:MAG: hypothetical protein ACD_29C00227G0003 [uncultured bacterium]
MSKQKTNSSAKKRFIKRGSGSVKKRDAFRNHILTKKSQKRKRHARALSNVDQSNLNGVLRMLRVK